MHDSVSFDDIFQRVGSATRLAGLIGVTPNSAKQMMRRNSIASEYWKALAESELVTLDELAAAAAAKRGAVPTTAAPPSSHAQNADASDGNRQEATCGQV